MSFLIQPRRDNDEERWLQRQFDRFERYLEQKLRLRKLTSAPLHPYEGQIVMADGTEWNPGSGGGLYVWFDGSWKKL